MKKTNKLLVLLLVMLMAMSLFMTGCGSDSEEGQEGQEAGGTLVIALQEEIEGTDIQQIGWENVVHALIYEPLVKYNADLSEMVPCFAESYEIAEDGLSITFTLPADAKFSNGDVLDADVVHNSACCLLVVVECQADGILVVCTKHVGNGNSFNFFPRKIWLFLFLFGQCIGPERHRIHKIAYYFQ